MKMIKFALVFLCFSFQLFAQDSNKAGQDILLMDPYLSTKYQRGSYLLYDCYDKHWVCTAKAEFDTCQDARSTASKNKDDKLPCMPLKAFESEAKCNEIQARIVSSSYGNRDCKSEELKEIDQIF